MAAPHLRAAGAASAALPLGRQLASDCLAGTALAPSAELVLAAIVAAGVFTLHNTLQVHGDAMAPHARGAGHGALFALCLFHRPHDRCRLAARPVVDRWGRGRRCTWSAAIVTAGTGRTGSRGRSGGGNLPPLLRCRGRRGERD